MQRKVTDWYEDEDKGFKVELEVQIDIDIYGSWIVDEVKMLDLQVFPHPDTGKLYAVTDSDIDRSAEFIAEKYVDSLAEEEGFESLDAEKRVAWAEYAGDLSR